MQVDWGYSFQVFLDTIQFENTSIFLLAPAMPRPLYRPIDKFPRKNDRDNFLTVGQFLEGKSLPC